MTAVYWFHIMLSPYILQQNCAHVWVEFIITDDVRKPQYILSSKVLGDGSTKQSICKLTLLHVIRHMYMTTTCLCRPLALGFVR